MKKSLMFAAVLCGTLAAAPAMAGEEVSADFHALSAMSSPVPAMTETQMSSVEGGGPVLDLLLGLPLVGPLVAALAPTLAGLPIVGPLVAGL